MNSQEMIAYTRLLVKEPTEDHYTDADILQFLNEAQIDVASRLEAKVTSVDVQAPAGSSLVAIPVDMLKFKKARIGQTVLPVKDAETLYAEDEDWTSATGMPTNIVPMGLLSVRLYPIPDSQVTVTLEYVQTPSTITDDASSVPELPTYAHRLLCKWAAYKLFLMDRAETAGPMLDEYRNELQEIQRMAWANRPKEDLVIDAAR